MVIKKSSLFISQMHLKTGKLKIGLLKNNIHSYNLIL